MYASPAFTQNGHEHQQHNDFNQHVYRMPQGQNYMHAAPLKMENRTETINSSMQLPPQTQDPDSIPASGGKFVNDR